MTEQEQKDFAIRAAIDLFGGTFPANVRMAETSRSLPQIFRRLQNASEAPPTRRLFREFAEEYPPGGPPVTKVDPNTGKEYAAKQLTPAAAEFAQARTRVMKEMEQDGYDRFFDPDQSFPVDPSNYPPNVNTLSIIPKQQKTIAKYYSIFGSESARQALRDAVARGSQVPGAANWYDMGQVEQKFIEVLGPEAGRREFLDFVTSIAATAAGNDPRSNLLMAVYANFLRNHGLPYPEYAHELPYPIGGRFAMSNINRHKEIMDAGGWQAIGTANPKPHDYGQRFFGNDFVAPIDERITSGMVPGLSAPPQGTYGIAASVLHNEAARAGRSPGEFSQLAWTGFGESHPPDSMIEYINEAIERTHRLTGMPREEVFVRGFVLRQIPIYGVGGIVVLPALQAENDTSSRQPGVAGPDQP